MVWAEQVALDELCDVTAGPSGALLDNLHDGPDGVPVISPPDLAVEQRVDTRRLRRVPQADAERLARFSLREGDILVVRQGSLGRAALVEAEHSGWLYSSSCLRLRPRSEQILPAYLVSYLTHPPVRAKLLSQALPGTVPSLNSATLNALLVTLPPMRQQFAIVDTLADVNAQIRTQLAILDRLEALKPALFEEMLQNARQA